MAPFLSCVGLCFELWLIWAVFSEEKKMPDLGPNQCKIGQTGEDCQSAGRGVGSSCPETPLGQVRVEGWAGISVLLTHMGLLGPLTHICPKRSSDHSGTHEDTHLACSSCTTQPPIAEREACYGGDPHPQLLHPLAFADNRSLGRLYGATG